LQPPDLEEPQDVEMERGMSTALARCQRRLWPCSQRISQAALVVLVVVHEGSEWR